MPFRRTVKKSIWIFKVTAGCLFLLTLASRRQWYPKLRPFEAQARREHISDARETTSIVLPSQRRIAAYSPRYRVAWLHEYLLGEGCDSMYHVNNQLGASPYSRGYVLTLFESLEQPPAVLYGVTCIQHP